MGAALIQEGRPITFASKSMTETESRYANIERELLAVVFALERFHTYVYGKHVTIFSDHKPLENIQYKNLAKAPPRLQRLLLRMQPYNTTVVHKPVKDMNFADYLSRVNPTP
ncbi:retrovirus-related pol polyprotein from transposon gypsy [Plakobranchus ocellatus]|uniref:Retrovirus-related pol polyprotein from transposon gypsy n=1 Tax=Plakobranchus ocellatus TaxID=259542 RepID=A0AAV3Y813_9GAST|nr:retrovirus-related pol polyprotein from transposon gypsy [Plakobranchus ocellatus]